MSFDMKQWNALLIHTEGELPPDHAVGQELNDVKVRTDSAVAVSPWYQMLRGGMRVTAEGGVCTVDRRKDIFFGFSPPDSLEVFSR